MVENYAASRATDSDRRGDSHYAPVEQIKRFEILPEDFSQPTGELTPTMMVKRGIVQQKYAETIDAISASPSDRIVAQPPR